MAAIGQRGRQTQSDITKFFQEELCYRQLGDWRDQDDNCCMEKGLLFKWLSETGNDDSLGQDAMLAMHLERIRSVKKADWRGNRFKERELRNAILALLESQAKETGAYDIDAVMQLVKAQHEY